MNFLTYSKRSDYMLELITKGNLKSPKQLSGGLAVQKEQ